MQPSTPLSGAPRRRRHSFADRGAHAAERYDASDSEVEELQRLTGGRADRRHRRATPLPENESDWIEGRDEELLVDTEGDLLTQQRLLHLRTNLDAKLQPDLQVRLSRLQAELDTKEPSAAFLGDIEAGTRLAEAKRLERDEAVAKRGAHADRLRAEELAQQIAATRAQRLRRQTEEGVTLEGGGSGTGSAGGADGAAVSMMDSLDGALLDEKSSNLLLASPRAAADLLSVSGASDASFDGALRVRGPGGKQRPMTVSDVQGRLIHPIGTFGGGERHLLSSLDADHARHAGPFSLSGIMPPTISSSGGAGGGAAGGGAVAYRSPRTSRVTDAMKSDSLAWAMKSAIEGHRLRGVDAKRFLRSIAPLTDRDSATKDSRRARIAELPTEPGSHALEFGPAGRLPFRAGLLLSHNPALQPPSKHPSMPHSQNFDRHLIDLGPSSYFVEGGGAAATAAGSQRSSLLSKKRVDQLRRNKLRHRPPRKIQAEPEPPGPTTYHPHPPSFMPALSGAGSKTSVDFFHSTRRTDFARVVTDLLPGPGHYDAKMGGFGMLPPKGLEHEGGVKGQSSSFLHSPRFINPGVVRPGGGPRIKLERALASFELVTKDIHERPVGQFHEVYAGRPDVRYASTQEGREIVHQLEERKRRRLRADLAAVAAAAAAEAAKLEQQTHQQPPGTEPDPVAEATRRRMSVFRASYQGTLPVLPDIVAAAAVPTVAASAVDNPTASPEMQDQQQQQQQHSQTPRSPGSPRPPGSRRGSQSQGHVRRASLSQRALSPSAAARMAAAAVVAGAGQKNFVKHNREHVVTVSAQSPHERKEHKSESFRRHRVRMEVVRAAGLALMMAKRTQRMNQIVAADLALQERRRAHPLHWPSIVCLVASFNHWHLRLRQRRAFLLINSRRERAAKAIQTFWQAYRKRRDERRIERSLMVLRRAFRVFIFNRRVQKKRKAASLIRKFLLDTSHQVPHRIFLYKKSVRRRVREQQRSQAGLLRPSAAFAMPSFIERSAAAQAQARAAFLREQARSAATEAASGYLATWLSGLRQDGLDINGILLSRGGMGPRAPRTLAGVIHQFKDRVLLVQRAWRRYVARRDSHVGLLLLLWDKVVEQQRRLAAETEAVRRGALLAATGRTDRRRAAATATAVADAAAAGLGAGAGVSAGDTLGGGRGARDRAKQQHHLSHAQSPGKGGAVAGGATAASSAADEQAFLDALTLVRIDKKFLLEDKRRLLAEWVRQKRHSYLDALRAYAVRLKQYVQDHNVGITATRRLIAGDGKYTREQAEADFLQQHPPPVFRRLPSPEEMISFIKNAMDDRSRLRTTLKPKASPPAAHPPPVSSSRPFGSGAGMAAAAAAASAAAVAAASALLSSSSLGTGAGVRLG